MARRFPGLINSQDIEDIELGSIRPLRPVTSFHLHQENESGLCSVRSSLDVDYSATKHCDVHIRDDVPIDFKESLLDEIAGGCESFDNATASSPPPSVNDDERVPGLPDHLRRRLEVCI